MKEFAVIDNHGRKIDDVFATDVYEALKIAGDRVNGPIPQSNEEFRAWMTKKFENATYNLTVVRK